MSDLFKNKFRISSARLQSWNYAASGMYFVTICTADRECFFGDIVETRCIASRGVASPSAMPECVMQLTDLGKIVELEWLKTVELRPDMNLELAEYVVMPNHFHGIITIGDNRYNTAKYDGLTRTGDAMPGNVMPGDATHRVSTSDHNANQYKRPVNTFGPQAKNLASILRGFKSAVTTFARKNEIAFGWQERFHDHIIGSYAEYLRIADYIINNPNKWWEDKFYKG